MKKLGIFKIENGVPVLNNKPLKLVDKWAQVQDFYNKNFINDGRAVAVYNCGLNKNRIITKEFYCKFQIQNDIIMTNMDL